MNGASNYWYSKCKINEAKFVKLKNEKQKLEESANSRILSLQWSLARSNERNEHLRSLVPPRIRDPSKFQKLGLFYDPSNPRVIYFQFCQANRWPRAVDKLRMSGMVQFGDTFVNLPSAIKCVQKCRESFKTLLNPSYPYGHQYIINDENIDVEDVYLSLRNCVNNN